MFLFRIANSAAAVTSLAHPYDAPEAIPLQEQVEGLVDLLQADFMRDQPIQLQLLHAFEQTKQTHPKW